MSVRRLIGPSGGYVHAVVAASSTGEQPGHELGAAFSGFTLQPTIVTSTAATVQLQGAIGGSTVWVNIGSAVTVDSTANGAMTLVQLKDGSTAKDVTKVRVDVTSFTTNAGSTAAESLDVWVAVV